MKLCINLERDEVLCVCMCVCLMGEGFLEIGVITYKDYLAREAGEQLLRNVAGGRWHYRSG